MLRYNGIIIGLLSLLVSGILLSAAEAHLELRGRKAFVFNEKDAFLKVSVTAEKGDFSNMELTGTIAALPIQTLIKAEGLASGNQFEFRVPVETRLSVGKYPISLTLKSAELEKPVQITDQILIGPELHDRMRIICGGYYPFHHHDIQKLGFTDAMQNWWRSLKYCDEMLFDGFRAMDSYPFLNKKELKDLPYRRQMRNGNPYPIVNVSHPKVQATEEELARKRGEILSELIAVEGVNINDEMRDLTKVSFDSNTREAFQSFAGYPIPQEVEEKDGVHYSTIQNFPLSRIVADNDPLLIFYKWFWKDGDGYNVLNNVMIKGYREGVKRPVWFTYAPAVRVPPIWGNGGAVNYIYHWTYSTPDPINIGANTSELQAMAEETTHKTILSENQIITYRSAVAPIGMKPENEPEWVKEFPKAKYVSAAPNMMEIAIWTQISRKVDAIMFHGLDSLLQNTHPHKTKDVGYQCTNHQTAEVLKELMHKVVKPLGPVLKRIPERDRDVAILESFASSVFAQRATWGWQGWPFELHLALLWANLAPKVLYDETILRDQLDGVKVLILPACDVLTESVYKIIADFQRKGGIIVGDQYLVPGITPDITIAEYKRCDAPDTDKAELQKIGVGLRDRLAPYYQPYVQTSNPDLVTWTRTSEDADYLFVVNDKRTFGDYFGPYKKVMEKSVDNVGEITIRRAKTAAVYDLVSHCEVPFKILDGKTVIQVAHDSKSTGKLFLLMPEKVAKVKLELPATAEKSKTIQLKVLLETASGKPVQSIHPIEIEVRDDAGNLTCDSTSAALKNGAYHQSLTIPLNANGGQWIIKVTDLASGHSIERSISIP